MLNRLLRLYARNGSNTPLEDFTTEVLASLLEKDPEILHQFTRNILGLESDFLKIETQKHYSLIGGDRAIVDLVLSNQEVICFIENKVNSGEGYNQLDKYSKILDDIPHYGRKYLFYCTKYPEPKEETRHGFKQFRWFEVARIMESSKNELAIEFYKFLKSNSMTQSNEITTKDLFLLENFRETVQFLESFLDRLRPLFGALVKKPAKPENISQMMRYSRYILYKPFILGEPKDKYNEIGAGFIFNTVPQACIWIYVSPKHPKAQKFAEYVELHKGIFHTYDKQVCQFNVDLAKFIGENGSLNNLEAWYRDNLEKVRSFINETPDLDWKIG